MPIAFTFICSVIFDQLLPASVDFQIPPDPLAYLAAYIVTLSLVTTIPPYWPAAFGQPDGDISVDETPEVGP